MGKPATEMYPQREKTYTPATRGMVQNEIESCIFCRMCERNCPTSALSVSKEMNEWEIDSLKCCLCRRCVEVCPVKCLCMDNVYFPSVRTRAEGKYLTVLPPGAVPAYQKAKEAAAKSREGKPEMTEASQVMRNENGGTHASS